VPREAAPISVYDIQRAVADKATVPIYYESRIAKLGLNEAALPNLDAEFEEITEAEEEISRERLKTKWAALEAIVGDPKRVKIIAADRIARRPWFQEVSVAAQRLQF
jgi:type I restriction enzyme R subunit